MAASPPDDVEDPSTCRVCFEVFDNENRKPYCLSCDHTLCLECAKSVMIPENLVTCPFCRKESIFGDCNALDDSLSIQKSSQLMKNEKESDSLPEPVGKLWCLKCRDEASESCSSPPNHTTISLESCSVAYVLSILKAKDNYESKIVSIIEKRKTAQKYLKEVSHALKIVYDRVKRLEEENDQALSEMGSLLAGDEKIIHEGDTIESFANKVQENTEKIDQELVDVKKLQDTYTDHIKNTKIFVQFKDQKGNVLPNGLPQFDSGFSPAGGQQGQPKTLAAVSHILLTLLKTRKRAKSLPLDAKPTGIIPRIDRAISNEIDFRYFVFSMNFFYRDRSLGTVLIRPDPRFYLPFSEALAQICHTPKQLNIKINKGLPSSFAIVEYSGHHLYPLAIQKPEELMLKLFDAPGSPGEDPMDIRFLHFSSEGNTITSFQLEFVLHPTRATRGRFPFFGRIVKGHEVVNNLSCMPTISHVMLSQDLSLQKTIESPTSALSPTSQGRKERLSSANRRRSNVTISSASELTQSGKISATSTTDNASLQEFIFAMKFSWKNRDVGTILIKPDKKFYLPFIEGLAKFCFASSLPFSGQIKGAGKNSFVAVKYSHSNFKESVPDTEDFLSSASLPLEALDVGFFDNNFKGDVVNAFELIFLLEPFDPEQMRKCTLFGKIVGGKKVIEELSENYASDHDSFSVSIEFGF